MDMRLLRMLPLVLIAACAPSAPAAQPAPNTRPALADTQKLVVGYPALAPNLDPGLSSSGSYRKYDIFETLIMLDDTGLNPEPGIAKEWKLVDPSTWRLTIRPDAKFQDGSPVTIDDIVFSWTRLADPALKSPVPGALATVAGIAAGPAGTIDVTTKGPDPLIIKRLTNLAVVPKAYVERVGIAEFGSKPIGSGPFKLKEFRADDRLVLTGWKEHPYRAPKLDEVTIRVIPEGAARVQGLRTGELDLTYQLSVEAVDSLKAGGFGVDARQSSTVGAYFDLVGFEGVPIGPISDRRVRFAMNYAIDRDTMAKTIYRGLVGPVGLVVPLGAFGSNADLKPYGFDVGQAKTLLAEAGYPNGFKTTLEFWSWSSEVQPTALLMQSNLKTIGVDLELQPIDFTAFRDKVYKTKPAAPLFLTGVGVSPLMDTDLALQGFWSETRTLGRRYNNPEFDRVFLQSRTEMDPAKREALLKQASMLLQQDAAYLPMVAVLVISAYTPSIAGLPKQLPDGDWYPFDRLYRTK